MSSDMWFWLGFALGMTVASALFSLTLNILNRIFPPDGRGRKW